MDVWLIRADSASFLPTEMFSISLRLLYYLCILLKEGMGGALRLKRHSAVLVISSYILYYLCLQTTKINFFIIINTQL